MTKQSLAFAGSMLLLVLTACDPNGGYERTDHIGFRNANEHYLFFHSGPTAGKEFLTIDHENGEFTIHCTEMYWIDTDSVIYGEICHSSPVRKEKVKLDKLPAGIQVKFNDYRQKARERWRDFDKIWEETH